MLPESPKFFLSKGKGHQSLKILKQIYLFNTGASWKNSFKLVIPATRNTKGSPGILHQICIQIKQLFAKETILQTLNFCVIIFIISFVGCGTYMWLPITISLYMADVGHSSDICTVIEKSQSGNSSSTYCSDPVDTSEFLILVYMGIGFTLFNLFISQMLTFVGKKQMFGRYSFNNTSNI